MSVSLYRSQVRQHESKLKSVRPRHATAIEKVAGLEKDIARITRQAKSTSSESMRRSYERQLETKERDLGRAKEAATKLQLEITTAEGKLAEAKTKLAAAEEAEARKREREEARNRQREEREAAARERREEAVRKRQEREEERARESQAARESEQERQIDQLHDQTADLRTRLAEAERRAAPPEITVLFLASNPDDTGTLRLDQETREIQKRVRTTDHRESIWFEWRLARQLTDLIEDINQVRPHVLHFSGHGSEAGLAFERPDGKTAELNNDQLGRLLGVGGERIRLAIFNSCDSSAQAELATNHVDIAVGMNASIDDDVAKTFAAQFYNSLGFGKSVGEAFGEALLQVEFEHGDGQDIPEIFAASGVDPKTVVLVSPNGAS